MALAVAVRNDDEAASLLDDDGGSPVPYVYAGVSPPPPLHGKATRRPGHAVMRLMRSPFAAVLRMTTCKRADDAISPSDKQPSKNAAAGAVAERRRDATRRRPSLEQLLRMEAAPPPPTSPSPSRRPDRKSKPDTTAPPSEVSTRAAAVKEKRAHEPLSPYKIHSSTVAAAVSDDNERHAAAAAPDAVKLDACGGRRTSAERLVVVFASSLRACSRSAGMPKGPNGKVAAAAAGRAPGKAELFYYRPIPMGRRCRVQHLEESPYK